MAAGEHLASSSSRDMAAAAAAGTWQASKGEHLASSSSSRDMAAAIN